ncbi:MAG: CoA transferase [Acidobacteria bacterium]|nr:CoA transferase [Acidobacteriota bacterium]
MSALPLAGIRVIDFGRYIAGPYCGMLLADMGADVIRIDRRGGSEDRFLGPITEGGEGGLFICMNRNKRSLTLDPGHPRAAGILERLVRGADVVIANLPIEVMRRMRIDYDSLRVLKPDVILVHVSAFGPDGPYANRVGFDSVSQAMSGAMSLTGLPGAPVRDIVSFEEHAQNGPRPRQRHSGVPQGYGAAGRGLCAFEDFGTALHAAFGAMVALYHRRRTGQGQLVNASLLATGVTFMQAFLAERHVTGRVRRQTGNAGFYSAPSNCYPARDGWIMVSVIGDAMFARWAKLVKRADLIADERMKTDQMRADNRALIDDAMTGWTAARTCDQAIAELETARVPAGRVLKLDQVPSEAQYVAYPGAPRDVPLAPVAVRLSETPGGIRRRAPLAGEHTEEVLREIGFSAAEVEEMRTLGVV